jgi:Vam6/Vps39-like protein vacuolar protein sorting-associated protein 39
LISFRVLTQLDGEQKDLFPTGKQPDPLVCSLLGEKFALGRDDQTILVDIEGNPSTKYTLTWSETPIFLGNWLILSIFNSFDVIYTNKCVS